MYGTTSIAADIKSGDGMSFSMRSAPSDKLERSEAPNIKDSEADFP
jgi:hypothetical protein